MTERLRLQCEDVAVSFGTRFGSHVVLDGLDVNIGPAERIALVGANGSGKSTLLGVLAGRVPVDRGVVHGPGGRVGVMEQVPAWAPGTSVTAVLEQSVAWARNMLHDVERAGTAMAAEPSDKTLAIRFAEAVATADAAEAWTATSVRDALAGPLLDGIRPDVELASLSGGQVGRLQVVHLLAGQPSTMLLDEPTTHMDQEAVDMLVEHLSSHDGPVVFASHDRQFVEDVATGVLDLDPMRGRPTVRAGGWAAYRDSRAAALAQWQDAHGHHRAAEDRVRRRARFAVRDRRVPTGQDNDKHIAHRHEQQASGTRAARGRRAAVDRDRLDADRIDKPPRPLTFRAEYMTAASPRGTLLSARGVAVTHRLPATRLDVSAGERLLVRGPNGSGKSTLLHCLAGHLVPSQGEVLKQPGVRVSLLSQNPPPMNQDVTASAWFDQHRASESTPALVELGLIHPRNVDRPMGELSEGQRRRLALAATIAAPPHVLLLDEPTDHLCLNLVEELEDALATSPGAVVVASHDRWLSARWDGRVVQLA